MIANHLQYRITKGWIKRFEADVEKLEAKPLGKEKPEARELRLEAMRSQLETLQSELEAYEALAGGEVESLEMGGLEELPKVLIKARIITGLSQEDLGKRVGLKKQQIQQYEKTLYQSASLNRLLTIAHALGVKVCGEAVVAA